MDHLEPLFSVQLPAPLPAHPGMIQPQSLHRVTEYGCVDWFVYRPAADPVDWLEPESSLMLAE